MLHYHTVVEVFNFLQDGIRQFERLFSCFQVRLSRSWIFSLDKHKPSETGLMLDCSDSSFRSIICKCLSKNGGNSTVIFFLGYVIYTIQAIISQSFHMSEIWARNLYVQMLYR